MLMVPIYYRLFHYNWRSDIPSPVETERSLLLTYIYLLQQFRQSYTQPPTPDAHKNQLKPVCFSLPPIHPTRYMAV